MTDNYQKWHQPTPHYGWLWTLVQAVKRTSGQSGSASEDDPAERGLQQIEDDTGLNANDAWRIAHGRKSWRALRPVVGQAFHWLTMTEKLTVDLVKSDGREPRGTWIEMSLWHNWLETAISPRHNAHMEHSTTTEHCVIHISLIIHYISMNYWHTRDKNTYFICYRHHNLLECC